MQCLCVESPTPSPFSHEILNANPYGFLDDAPLEERRSRAVSLRHVLPPEEAATVGALDADAIAAVCEEAWPRVRDADELQEALHLLAWVPEDRAAELARLPSRSCSIRDEPSCYPTRTRQRERRFPYGPRPIIFHS